MYCTTFQALAAGINVFDTADMYSDGESERVVGKPHHLDQALGAREITLTAEEIEKLEAPYVPHEVVGFS